MWNALLYCAKDQGDINSVKEGRDDESKEGKKGSTEMSDGNTHGPNWK